jgi:L-threonylcarbamoyladenylate synthase
MQRCGTHIEEAIICLKNGALVGIPTETVYGLAANALNEQAVLRIFEAKNRPHFDPLILHVKDVHSVEKYASWHDARLKKLAETFWPGPLTLLLPKKNCVPDLVTSGLPQVAIRIPKHALTLELLSRLDFPLAAPSANPFGYISPTRAEHVMKQLGEKVCYTLDGGACSVGIESTIIGLEDGELCVYRLGGLSLEDIEACVGPIQMKLNTSSDPKAPGQLKNHYAPKKPLFIGDVKELAERYSDKNIFLMVFKETDVTLQQGTVRVLSKSGNVKEAAVSLFAVLREADESDAEVILAEWLPEQDLGPAINDRLKRASVPN